MSDSVRSRFISSPATLVLLALGISCSRQPSASWESDFDAFAAALKSSIKNGENLEAKFRPKTAIEWKVTFGKLNGSSIEFIEAGSLQKDRPPVRVWLTIADAEKAKAAQLKVGDMLVASCQAPFVVVMESPSVEVLYSPNNCTLKVGTSSAANEPAPASLGPQSAERKSFRVDGPGGERLDMIVRRIGASSMSNDSQETLDAILSDRPAARPNKTTKLSSTTSGFSGAGTVKSTSPQGCTAAAYSDRETKFESRGDGSQPSILSPLIGTFVKVFCDLPLEGTTVVIPNGTVLRRDDGGWASTADASALKRLDSLKK